MDRETAVRVSVAADAVLSSVGALLDAINQSCDQETRKRVQLALGTVIAEVDLEILEPIYKQYPDLRPGGLEEIRGQ